MNDQPHAPLHRLVYVSRAADFILPSLYEEVEHVLFASRRNNAAAGVTGALVVHEVWFIQTLEGRRADVDATYGRIAADPRHAEVSLKMAGPVAARRFSAWSMSARTLTEQGRAAVVRPGNGFDPYAMTGDQLLKLLEFMAAVNAPLRPPARKAS